MKNLKIALVHDYLNQYGGGERVIETLHEIWPEANVYTSLYDKKIMKSWLKIPEEKIKTNFINRLPFANYLSKHYFFLYPLAFRLQNLGDADVIISSTSFAAKFAKGKKDSVRICYIYTPPRFLYGYDTELSKYERYSFDKFLRYFYQILVPVFKFFLIRMDKAVVKEIDHMVVISEEIRKRIKQHYNRDSFLIYPPVDTKRFQNQKIEKKGDYYLIVSRLGGYKKVDIAVKAFNKLGSKLKIVGQGPQFAELQKLAAPNVELLGRISDQETTKLFLGAKALIFPTDEDFGIVPVEAMAAGIPVIAYGKGGALETIIDGKTGLFFDEQTPESIIRTIKKFEELVFSPEDCKKQAEKFSKEVFKKNMLDFVESHNKKQNRNTE